MDKKLTLKAFDVMKEFSKQADALLNKLGEDINAPAMTDKRPEIAELFDLLEFVPSDVVKGINHQLKEKYYRYDSSVDETIDDTHITLESIYEVSENEFTSKNKFIAGILQILMDADGDYLRGVFMSLCENNSPVDINCERNEAIAQLFEVMPIIPTEYMKSFKKILNDKFSN